MVGGIFICYTRSVPLTIQSHETILAAITRRQALRLSASLGRSARFRGLIEPSEGGSG